MSDLETFDPHAQTPIVSYGVPLDEARAAVLLLHGRGASPQDILFLAAFVDPGGVAYLAPQAAQSSWYPQSFLAPLESNQPWLDSALRRIASLLDDLEARGFPVERILLAGFSQGACLALEYVCKNARRYGGVVGFSGGLIGPNGLERGYDGSLERTSILLGCSDVDPYIPLARVRHTEQIMTALGADVDMQVYSGWGHAVHPDGIDGMREILSGMVLGA